MADNERKIVLRERTEIADGTTAFWFTLLFDSAGFETPSAFSFRAGQWVDITLLNPRTHPKSTPEPRCEECARDARRDEESVAAALQLRGATLQPGYTPATRRDRANCPHRGVATPSEYPADTPSVVAPSAAGQLAPIAARDTFGMGSNRDDGGTTRTFSIASSPHIQGKFMVVMRNGKSAFKRSLRELAIGAEVKLTGLGGSFVLPEKSDKEIVMIAGGIGVAPMRGVVEWATHERASHRITLLYSNRTAGEAAFLDELRAWEKENKNFKLAATITESFDLNWKGERGRIDEAMLKRHVADVLNARYYIAGPPAMVSSTWQMLVGMGVDDGAIKTEEFSGY